MELNKEKINEILKNDGVIAFVTDTVWGLGCLPSSEKAVKRIYELKKRSEKKPLILMSNAVSNLVKYVDKIYPKAESLMEQYFPGPLTLVLKKSDKTPIYVTKNLDTVGIRVPNNEVFKQICDAIEGKVLATTSANLSNEPPALTYEQALDYIGKDVDLVIPDFGHCAKGKASTVAGVFDDEVIVFRQGDVYL